MVATTIVLLLYVICSSIGPIARGYVNKAGLTFIFLIGILLVPIVITLLGVGFFEPMMERFEYDYGSALSRDYALQLLQQSSAWDLWFGRSVAEINEIQQSYRVNRNRNFLDQLHIGCRPYHNHSACL